MAKLDSDYLQRLDKYINDPATAPENREKGVANELKGNVAPEEIRANMQALLYLVIDKSISMRSNGLEEAVRQGLEDVKRTVNGSIEVDCIQTAMTFFGSTIEMRPFQYGERIDISYEANEPSTRLYDAVIKSCKNMVDQYDKLEPNAEMKGVMFIFTDGEENNSEHNLEDLQRAIRSMLQKDPEEKETKRNIKLLVTGFKGADIERLAKEFETEPIVINNDHIPRRLMRFVSKTAME